MGLLQLYPYLIPCSAWMMPDALLNDSPGKILTAIFASLTRFINHSRFCISEAIFLIPRWFLHIRERFPDSAIYDRCISEFSVRREGGRQSVEREQQIVNQLLSNVYMFSTNIPQKRKNGACIYFPTQL